MKFVWKQSLLNSFKFTELPMKVCLIWAENVIHRLNKCYTKSAEQEERDILFSFFSCSVVFNPNPKKCI